MAEGAPEFRVILTCPFLSHHHGVTFLIKSQLVFKGTESAIVCRGSGMFIMNDYCSPDSSLAKWLRAFLGINRGGFMYVSQHSLLQLQEASTGGWAGTGGARCLAWHLLLGALGRQRRGSCTCTSTTWMESQQPLIFFDPSPAFFMRITPAKP